MDKGNLLKNLISDFALKFINPEGSYEEAFSGRNENVNPVTDAAWRKYLGKDYDESLIIKNEDGSFRLPPNVENEIIADTNFVKNRISNNIKQRDGMIKINPDHSSIPIFESGINRDSILLNKLRDMYKGKPIVVNEYDVWKNRKLINKGELNTKESSVSPLNVLQNFTLKYNPKTDEVEYFDTYDLDKIPLVDKIYNPFKIKGLVPKMKNEK